VSHIELNPLEPTIFGNYGQSTPERSCLPVVGSHEIGFADLTERDGAGVVDGVAAFGRQEIDASYVVREQQLQPPTWRRGCAMPI
jgi:hypothetical protein